MVSERVVAMRDEMRRATSVATMIGAVAGGITAFIALVANGKAGMGLLGSLLSNVVGVTVVLVLAVVLGIVFGALLGAIEGAIVFVLAHRSARKVHRLPMVTALFVVCLSLVNFTVSAFATALVFGISGDDPVVYFAAAIAAAMTTVAVIVFAYVQSTDWPDQIKSPYTASRMNSRDVVDLTNAEHTMRHERLVFALNDRLAQDQQSGERKAR